MGYRKSRTTAGELAEWLRSGLQIRVQEFDSPTRLQTKSTT
jgi:hypothetical protein